MQCFVACCCCIFILLLSTVWSRMLRTMHIKLMYNPLKWCNGEYYTHTYTFIQSIDVTVDYVHHYLFWHSIGLYFEYKDYFAYVHTVPLRVKLENSYSFSYSCTLFWPPIETPKKWLNGWQITNLHTNSRLIFFILLRFDFSSYMQCKKGIQSKW